MQKQFIRLRVFGLAIFSLLLVSHNTKEAFISENVNPWVMDIAAYNNTNSIVDYVKFESSLDSKTFSNLAANGGGDGGIFEWEVREGLGISVKLRAYPGSGSIKVFHGSTLVDCMNFTNHSSSIVYTFLNDFSNVYWWNLHIYIENTAC